MFHCSVTLGKILHEDCSLCISDDSELVLVIAQDAICCFVWVWWNCLSMEGDGTQIEKKALRRIF